MILVYLASYTLISIFKYPPGNPFSLENERWGNFKAHVARYFYFESERCGKFFFFSYHKFFVHPRGLLQLHINTINGTLPRKNVV